MEVGKEQPSKSPDGAQLNYSVPERAMLINTALLIVLGIICKGSEDLRSKPTEI
jgi:hypothetical protein